MAVSSHLKLRSAPSSMAISPVNSLYGQHCLTSASSMRHDAYRIWIRHVKAPPRVRRLASRLVRVNGLISQSSLIWDRSRTGPSGPHARAAVGNGLESFISILSSLITFRYPNQPVMSRRDVVNSAGAIKQSPLGESIPPHDTHVSPYILLDRSSRRSCSSGIIDPQIRVSASRSQHGRVRWDGLAKTIGQSRR